MVQEVTGSTENTEQVSNAANNVQSTVVQNNAPVGDAAGIANPPVNTEAVANTVNTAGTAPTLPTAQAHDAAVQTATTSESMYHQFVDFMQLGGPVVWILVAFSIIAVTIFVMKLVQLIQERPESKNHLPAVIKHWQNDEREDALRLLDVKRPIDHMILTYIKGLDQGMSMDVLKEEVERIATLRINRLTAFLRPLEIIATLSPLLGLLGTVLGMIEAFQHMQDAGSQVDPSVLSGGIWKALLTTAVGLVVAIPVMLMFNFLERKVERTADFMNDAITRIFTSK